MRSPAFQFYPDDFVGGTVALTTEGTGAYILLLCYQWGNGKIPSEKTAIDRIAGCNVSDDILAKFPNGKNKRLEEERRKQSEYREKQRLNGIESGKARRERSLNHRSTTVEPSLNGGGNQTPTKTNSPSPSPSPNSIKTNGEMDSLELYNLFEKRLGVLFNREPGDKPGCLEMQAIAEVCRRPNALNELGEIESYHQKEQRFFPRTLVKIVTNWQSVLDSARVWKPNRTPQEEREFKNLMRQWS